LVDVEARLLATGGIASPPREARATVGAYYILRDERPHEELGGDYFIRRDDRERVTRRLVRHLERLGQRVTLEPTTAEARVNGYF
jgi:hypothetical protein